MDITGAIPSRIPMRQVRFKVPPVTSAAWSDITGAISRIPMLQVRFKVAVTSAAWSDIKVAAAPLLVSGIRKLLDRLQVPSAPARPPPK